MLTTAMSAKISAYSTSAWPSSRSRIDATHVCSPTYIRSIPLFTPSQLFRARQRGAPPASQWPKPSASDDKSEVAASGPAGGLVRLDLATVLVCGAGRESERHGEVVRNGGCARRRRARL